MSTALYIYPILSLCIHNYGSLLVTILIRLYILTTSIQIEGPKVPCFFVIQLCLLSWFYHGTRDVNIGAFWYNIKLGSASPFFPLYFLINWLVKKRKVWFLLPLHTNVLITACILFNKLWGIIVIIIFSKRNKNDGNTFSLTTASPPNQDRLNLSNMQIGSKQC